MASSIEDIKARYPLPVYNFKVKSNAFTHSLPPSRSPSLPFLQKCPAVCVATLKKPENKSKIC